MVKSKGAVSPLHLNTPSSLHRRLGRGPNPPELAVNRSPRPR